MNIGNDFTGLVAIILSLSVPIVFILMAFISYIKIKRRDTEVRLAIIKAGTDAETAKILTQPQSRKNKKYSALRWGCALVGVGLGALCNAILHANNIYFMLIIAAGMGVGLLASFIIEYRLEKKQMPTENIEQTEE